MINYLQRIKPASNVRLETLVSASGCCTAYWNANDNFRWAFEDHSTTVVTLWWCDMTMHASGKITTTVNYREVEKTHRHPGQKARARQAGMVLWRAFNMDRAVKVIIVDGFQGNEFVSSHVTARELDSVTWKVESYDSNGNITLTRN